jgi:hypothetical protein
MLCSERLRFEKILIRVNSHPSERKERTVYHYSIEYLHYDLFQR